MNIQKFIHTFYSWWTFVLDFGFYSKVFLYMYPVVHVQRFLKGTCLGVTGHLWLIIVTSSVLLDDAKFFQHGCEWWQLFFLPPSLPSSLLSSSLYSFSTEYNFPLLCFITAPPIIWGALLLHRVLLVISTQQLDRVQNTA